MGRHVRLDDWPSRLSKLIHSRVHAPFDWGTNDCMMWAADCVEAQTGVDDLAAYRGRYGTARGALRALRRIDQVELPIELMDRLWGPREHISKAKLGDLVAVDLGSPRGMGPSIGLCYGRNSLFVGSEGGHRGLVTLQTLTLEHCYLPWVSSSRPSSP